MAQRILLLVVISSSLFYTHSAPTTTNNKVSYGERLIYSVVAARNIIRLYQLDLDAAIPWKDLNTTIEALGVHSAHFSERALDSIHPIRQMLSNTLNKYFEASQKVYEWTLYAAPVLDIYLKNHQQDALLLTGVVDESFLALNTSNQKLNVVHSELDRANNELHKLNDQLKLDFNVNGTYYQAKLAGFESERDKGIEEALKKSVTSTFDAFRTSNANRESKITALNDQLWLSERFYNIVSERIHNAKDSVLLAKNAIFTQFDEIKAYKTESTTSTNQLSTDQRELIKEYVTKLIEQCNEYIRVHGVRE